MLKLIAPALFALAATATAASALTISNTSDKEVTVGLDHGDKETTHKIAPGKSLSLKDDCKQGCGVTGPWSYSKMAMNGDKIETDGKPLVVVD